MKRMERNTGLDLVRAFAIVLILFLHASIDINGLSEQVKSFGAHLWFGVDIFFVLSGLLIGKQIFQETVVDKKKSLWNFWMKRWFRTLPLYFLLLFTYTVIKPTLLKSSFNGDWSSYTFFLQNFMAPKDFVQSWSLCIEEQFYIFFPLVVYFIPVVKRSPKTWLLLMASSLLSRYFIFQADLITTESDFSYLMRFPTHTHLDGIAMGVYLAATEKSWKEVANKYSALFMFFGMSILCLTMYFVGAAPLGIGTVYCFTLLAVGSAFLIMGAMSFRVPKFIYPVVYWISITSYGTYLWNNVLMRFVHRYFSDAHWSISMIFFFGMTFFISYITYRLVEMPFMKMRKKALVS